ncbi:hypothetical protein D3C81_138250 [compost metagenome]|uniref:hypothetical protein n=1 Tax=unclassified Janthinobacterium TaxID=2610881 RepID=UPI000C8508C3|nr:hypothetical protein [Janthinobacterium sp. AD80]PMQ16904.1 hypothetical protein JaAD80_07835 [Janthinobacterium sp. AD80]
MKFATPQRTITISILGTDHNAQALYSFWSPLSGLSYQNSPSCDINCNQPTDCLFILDFEATRHGWTIVNTTPKGSSPVLEQVPGARHLSVMTINPYTSLDTYNFYINYRNTITGAELAIDPQEGNIPPLQPTM